jgi:hypothetical protein
MFSKNRFCGIAAVLTILTPLCPDVGYSQTAICPGPLRVPHPMGAFNFETNSRLDPFAEHHDMIEAFPAD